METYSQNEDEWPDDNAEEWPDNAEEWPDVVDDTMQIDSMAEKLDSNVSDNIEMSKNMSYNQTQIKVYTMTQILNKQIPRKVKQLKEQLQRITSPCSIPAKISLKHERVNAASTIILLFFSDQWNTK